MICFGALEEVQETLKAPRPRVFEHARMHGVLPKRAATPCPAEWRTCSHGLVSVSGRTWAFQQMPERMIQRNLLDNLDTRCRKG